MYPTVQDYGGFLGVILMRVGLQLMWIHDCCVPIGVWICCCTAVLVCLVDYGTCGLAKAACSVVMPGTFSEFLVLTGVADGFIFKGKRRFLCGCFLMDGLWGGRILLL